MIPIQDAAPPTRVVVDYDFTFTSGGVLPITVDEAAGDSVSFQSSPVAVVITLAAKPSPVNPDLVLPEEEITIFQSHLLAIQKRSRVVQDLTQAQLEEWNALLKQQARVF